jgi:hypothetical protein
LLARQPLLSESRRYGTGGTNEIATGTGVRETLHPGDFRLATDLRHHELAHAQCVEAKPRMNGVVGKPVFCGEPTRGAFDFDIRTEHNHRARRLTGAFRQAGRVHAEWPSRTDGTRADARSCRCFFGAPRRSRREILMATGSAERHGGCDEECAYEHLSCYERRPKHVHSLGCCCVRLTEVRVGGLVRCEFSTTMFRDLHKHIFALQYCGDSVLTPSRCRCDWKNSDLRFHSSRVRPTDQHCSRTNPHAKSTAWDSRSAG